MSGERCGRRYQVSLAADAAAHDAGDAERGTTRQSRTAGGSDIGERLAHVTSA